MWIILYQVYLGEASLAVDPTVPQKVLPCRKIPIAPREEVKAELDHLLSRGILILVEEPTPWVSLMAVVRKSNGKLRLCIDPQPLNVALQREHYRLPTFNDVLPKLLNVKCSVKLM